MDFIIRAFLTGLVGGAAAFAHCLGMCGGFPLHLGGEGRQNNLVRQLLWNAGRIISYVFLGALAGFVGTWAIRRPDMAGMQNILAWVAGAWMIVMGLVAAGLVPMRKKTAPSDTASSGGGLFVSILRPIFVSPTPTAALMLGVATGFLPCPIVAGFLAMALESASVPAGMAVMAGLGVGSCWSLLLLGLTGGAIRARFGRWSSIIGAAVLILLGTATLLRGTDAFHRLMGCSDASCGATENPACHCKTMAATNTSSQPASAPSSMSSAPPVVCPHCRTDSTSQTAPTSRP